MPLCNHDKKSGTWRHHKTNLNAMVHGRDKYQSRENRARVRAVLLRDWDPIGVYGIPEAADEYDSYAAEAYVMLIDQDATESDIAEYLYDIATDHMGLSDRQRMADISNRAARVLVDLRNEFNGPSPSEPA